MQTRKKHNRAIAWLFVTVFLLGLLPVSGLRVLAQRPDASGSPDATVEPAPETDPAAYTVFLDPAGGTLPDLAAQGWTASGEGWTSTLTESQPGAGVILSVAAPQREGFLFIGWQLAETGETLEALAGYPVTQDLHCTALWQESPTPQPVPSPSAGEEDPDAAGSDASPSPSGEAPDATPVTGTPTPAPAGLPEERDQPTALDAGDEPRFAVDFTKAVYELPFVTNTVNTVNFAHANTLYPMKMKDVLDFLNANLPTVTVDYTVTWTDDAGTEHSVQRSGAEISLQWAWESDWQAGDQMKSTADFREIERTALFAMDGKSLPVQLNERYLREQIAAYEKALTQDPLPDGAALTEADLILSDWGNWDDAAEQYKGGDAELLALKIQIGSDQSQTPGITGNAQYLIDTVSPSNVTLNVFDYWLLSPAYYDQHVDTASALYTSALNRGHGLIFFKNGASGKWNSWTGQNGAPTTGIVQRQLGSDGYPVLDLKNTFGASGTFDNKYFYDPVESLRYLFDPEILAESGAGVGYPSVQGLFKLDDAGNYYYSSHENFAEFVPNDKKFNVYNTWGVRPGGTSPEGQFFPFNTANQVFKLDANGQLTQNRDYNSLNALINHYLGLSMEVDFQQPMNGMTSVGANARPMVFEFSGDDDVWLFIDGVLVADLGGIHDEASVEIDFSTGEVVTYLTSDPTKHRTTTTLKELFLQAGVSEEILNSFNGDTLGNNTTHTLKMFYLERGNADSNLTLSFNLLPPAENTLLKLDQDGRPMSKVPFSLYPAIWDETTESYQPDYETLVAQVTTDSNGLAVLDNYDFSLHDYYILEETPPEGYFSPAQVLLRYDRFTRLEDGTTTGTNLLMVDNRWETGAVSNFSAAVYQAGTLRYDTGQEIDRDTGSRGLIVAVPLLKGSDGDWHALYGSNMTGFHDVTNTTGADDDQNARRSALEAALYQIYGAQRQSTSASQFPVWYLEWDGQNGRYEGNLLDLPGEASRYYWASNSPTADLTMAYYFLDPDALDIVFPDLAGKSTDEKLAGIAAAIDPDLQADLTSAAVQQAVQKLVEQIDHAQNFALLDVSDFNRVFSSRIYVPNISPELRVLKLDEDGNPLSGVSFDLYEGKDRPGADAKPLVTGTTGDDGILVFSHDGTDTPGSARVTFKGDTYYWVREKAAPDGYIGNETFIPVYVTNNGRVYADALEKDDGITVRKGLGRLLETMVRYAAEDSVNVTLRDITATLVTGAQWEDMADAVFHPSDPGPSMHLHYGLDNALLEYGTHADGGVAPPPYFEVDEDIAALLVQQNYDAHDGDILYSSVANKIDLQDTNIRNLFTGSTTLVVRNRHRDALGSFSVAKTVGGTGVTGDETFRFAVKITGTQAWDPSTATYKVTDGSDTLETGALTFAEDSEGSWKIQTATPNASTTQTGYFEKDTDGFLLLKLQDGQKISVEEVPFDLNVTVTETKESAEGYTTTVTINGVNPTQTITASGIVKEEVGDPSFLFHNHKDKTADLTLQKFLPDEPDSTAKFPFTIDLKSSEGVAPLTGTYTYTVTDEAGTQTFTGGSLTVYLGHDDTLVIKDLPVGTQYIIRETTQGYAPAVTINGQTVQVNGGAVSGSVVAPPDPDTGTDPDTRTGTDTDPGTDPDSGTTPGTGDGTDVSPFLGNTVIYNNTRSGSITITKRSGLGTLLSGAGFTLYTVDEATDTLTEYRPEQMTALALRCTFDESESNFDRDTMRYNDGTLSYVVHTAAREEGGTEYFYYRFLTESERNQYYAGTFADAKDVEAIVQFTELPLDQVYALRETTVPDGYLQTADFEADMSHIELPFQDGTNKVCDILYTVTNYRKMSLPVTGLDGLRGPLAAGLLLLALAGALFWAANRKALVKGRRTGPHFPR